MRMQPSVNNTIQVIDALIVNIRDEEVRLNTTLATMPIDHDELEVSLQLLAGHFVDLRARMDQHPAWTHTNAEAYNVEVAEHRRLCATHFPSVNILGNVIPTFYPIFHPDPLPVNPDPVPIAIIVPPSTLAKIVRITLFLGGGVSLITGVAFIAASGFKLAGAIAANELAKKAGEAAAKKAAEELAKQLSIQAVRYLGAGIGQAAMGGLTVWTAGKIGLPTRVVVPGIAQPQPGNNR